MSGQSSTQEPKHLLERMLFLSDAVFAIALTLLVLDLRVPAGITDGDLGQGLIGMIPKFVAFTISFALVAVFWLGHAAVTRSLVKFDWGVACANLVLLFTIAWTPFAAALLGEFGVAGNAWRFYCGTLIAIGIGQVLLVLVVSRGHGRLVGGLDRREFWHRVVSAASPGIGFTVALVFSLMGYPLISTLSWVVIPVVLIGSKLLLNPTRKAMVVESPAAA
jgi:uncharacterized membrane protein